MSIHFSSDGALQTVVASDGGVFPTKGSWEEISRTAVALSLDAGGRRSGIYRYCVQGDTLTLTLVTGDSWANGVGTSAASPTAAYLRQR